MYKVSGSCKVKARGVWHTCMKCVRVFKVESGFRCVAGLVAHRTLWHAVGAARQERLKAAA
eukprot:5382242-Pleurochrysis_carterae.AAC.1